MLVYDVILYHRNMLYSYTILLCYSLRRARGSIGGARRRRHARSARACARSRPCPLQVGGRSRIRDIAWHKAVQCDMTSVQSSACQAKLGRRELRRLQQMDCIAGQLHQDPSIYIYIYIYIHIHIHTHSYIFIHIYIERERDVCMCMCMYINMNAYIHIYIHTHASLTYVINIVLHEPIHAFIRLYFSPAHV